MTKEPESWSFLFPKVIDEDGPSPPTLTVEFGAASFCTLTDMTSIDIEDVSDATKVKPGMYLLNVVLSDGKDTVKIPLSLIVLAPPADPEEAAQEETTAEEVTQEEA